MRLWRVSRHRRLDGGGGIVAAGRWHSRGRPVIYTADSPALAVLGVLVHLEIDAGDHPVGYHLFELVAPDGQVRDGPPRRLPADWPRREAATRSHVARSAGGRRV